jgi:hypothetical protein
MGMEYRLSVDTDIVCSEFESFCREGYSLSRLFQLKSVPTETSLVQYKLELIAARYSEVGRFEFRPAPQSQSFITFRLSDAQLDVELEGIGPLLCVLLFCDFVLYLEQMGF